MACCKLVINFLSFENVLKCDYTTKIPNQFENLLCIHISIALTLFYLEFG